MKNLFNEIKNLELINNELSSDLIDTIKKACNLNDDKNSNISGKTYGNVSSSSVIYGEEKFNTPRGHGFAAERANHLYDYLRGNDVKILGDDNQKNGADRSLNGEKIQSKYCATGSKCISECFENGKFRYLDNGKPMQIEVPSDKYDSAVQSMKERIKKGEVEGISNPEKATEIVKKGNFTYEQAKNIAKAGTVESLVYDSVNGVIVSSKSLSTSTLIVFARALWSGKSLKEASTLAAYEGIKSGGNTFITHILAGQLTKAGAAGLLKGSSDEIVKLIGPKASAVLANALRDGKNIYGAAAMNNASKLLRSNALASIASFAVSATPDVIDAFRGKISGKQLFKNLVDNGAEVGGGIGGWAAGAAAGGALGSVVPLVGNATGALVGGAIGAMAGGKMAKESSKTVTKFFVEDDAVKMTDKIEDTVAVLANDYLLNDNELATLLDNLKDKITGDTLKDMYVSEDKDVFADSLVRPEFESIVKDRSFINSPTIKDLTNGLKNILDNVAYISK